jgi:PEGA domain
MKRLLLIVLFSFVFTGRSVAQSGAVMPQSGAGHAAQASCVILKRMGPADEVTSHLYSFGIRGKQFQYVEGKLPEGFPFHGRLTDHDVRNLQARGAEVIVVESHYTAEDLKQARQQCQGETGKTPNQEDQKAVSPVQSTEVVTPVSTPSPKADPPAAPTVSSNAGALVEVASNPSAADIEVDGNFVGSTPSSLSLTSGEHEIAIKKNGFGTWKRKISVTTGSIHLNAELSPEAPSSEAAKVKEQ